MKRLMVATLVAGSLMWIAWSRIDAQQKAPGAPPPAASTQAPQATPSPAPAPDAAENLEPMEPGKYLGVASCAGGSCHGAPAPVENTSVLMNEYDTWLHASSPTHVSAYDVLLNRKSKQIARNLRLKTAPENADLCLDCHTLNVPERLKAGPVEIADGISCEACHGPASGWRATHFQEGWTHEKSVAAGMIDTKDIGTRARMCLDCHSGNANKEVDHELIAAGHPILTFELDNFTESRLMPAHWKPWNADDPATPRDTHGVRAWAVGQVVTFRDGLGQLARHAQEETWPEFSEMSCSSCHQELKNNEWRLERGYDHRAGLPQWSPKRWAVLRYLVSSVAPEQRERLDASVRDLELAVERMSDRARIVSAANALRDQLAPIDAKLDAATWNERRIRSIMDTIAADGSYFAASADKQAAEQATYGLITLSGYLVAQNPRLARSPLVASVDALYKELSRSRYPDDFDRLQFSSRLATIRQQLQ